MTPYEKLPKKAFWRPAVADRAVFDIDQLWSPKFRIENTQPVATFGSCFAQYIGAALKARGFLWLTTEPPPRGLNEQSAKLLNYDVFSCRTGNIYTTSLLRQWTAWAIGERQPPDEYWETENGYFDPFRPRIEPDGFESLDELKRSRQVTIDAFRAGIEQCQYFVFTLGLTESWINHRGGYEYPMCPGTVGGKFDGDIHKFVNHDFSMVINNLRDSIKLMLRLNPRLKFILTVSPVPLTATKSDHHVLVATMYSKSVLRAVAGQLANNNDNIDYFPSYEIINSPVFRGMFFEPNQRTVSSYGVNFVMNHFFRALAEKFGAPPRQPDPTTVDEARKKAAVCEEELLEAFGGGH